MEVWHATKELLGGNPLYTHEEKKGQSVTFLNVTDADCEVDEIMGFRSNDENVSVIVKPISIMARRDRSILKDLVILGFYSNQKWLTMEHLGRLAASLGSPTVQNLGVSVVNLAQRRPTTIKDLGLLVVNTDGFEGGEKRFVILDRTVTNRLGFLTDNRRYTVATTRARQFLCMVGSNRKLDNDYANRKVYTLDGDVVENLKSPMVHRYLDHLTKSGNIFDIEGAPLAQETFSTKKYWSEED